MSKKKHAALPNPCKAKLVRDSKYRKTCVNPVNMPTGSSPYKNEIHHILCEHAILDIAPLGDTNGEKAKYIKNCLCCTEWDINAADNLVGLPLKSAYVTSDGKEPQLYCCHNVDHNTSDGYTNECKQWLHDYIWNTLVDQKKPHNVNEEAILEQLKNCITYFKWQLQERGCRNSGTQFSYENRQTEAEWYAPFSMALNPTPRSPGGRWPKILNFIG